MKKQRRILLVGLLFVSVSLGAAAEREWAPKKLVKASPPHAEQDRLAQN